MNHLSEEELILHYYSEEADAFVAEQHLDQCEECRAHYAGLQRVLNVVDSLPVPARGEEYGGQVWRRIEGRLPSRRRWGGVRLAGDRGVYGRPDVSESQSEGPAGADCRE